MLNTFKNLVNKIEATITCKKDFEKEYGISLEDKPITFPKDTILNEIETIFKSHEAELDKNELDENVLNKIALDKINTELIYRHIICDENLIQCMQVMDILHQIMPLSVKFIPTWDDKIWEDIIKLSKNYLNLFESSEIDIKYLKSRNKKEFNRAESVKYLVSQNCKISIINDEIKFISGLDKIYESLEQKISEFGGLNLIFECLAKFNYNSKFERYIFIKKSAEEPAIPWAYLLNLSLKHLNFKHNSKKPEYEKLFKEIIDLSIKLINGVYTVQENNFWNHYFLDLKNIPQFVSKLLLYDSLFTIPQSNGRLELRLCEDFFSFDQEFFEKNLGFTLDEFIDVGKNLCNNEKNKPILIQLSKNTKYPLHHDKILKFMSHTNNLNKNYIEPHDYQKINFFEKPLIKYDATSFLLPAVSWSAPNFYECLVGALRKPYEQQFGKNLDEYFGEKLEEFIAILLNEHDINFIKGGKYDYQKFNGECDFIIECKNSIIIIEAKKKPLTRKSKSGQNYNIFIDLSKSLLKSQIQAGKVELLLKENEKIILKENKTEHEILLGDRTIKRISLTQFEYGSLHNKLFVEKFLKSLLKGEFGLEDGYDRQNLEFEEFIKYGKEFKEQYLDLNKLQKENFNNFILRCYFMSLPQFFEVIKRSFDNDSFDENLSRNNIETGTFDWHYEYGFYNS